MTFLSSLQPLDLPEPGSTVAVALSGGVDSSLVASLLTRRGCKVVGVTMRIYDPLANPLSTSGKGCYGPFEEEDEKACRRLCDSLGAEYYVFDLAETYGKEILGNFKDEYRAGRTPNPCLRCNPLLKFGLLPGKLKEKGIHFDYYATGHYVQLLASEGDVKKGVYIAPARDASKDQSYFLQRLSTSTLEKVRFPLGPLLKEETRRLALEQGLEVAEKADSQDFLGKEDYGPLFSDAPSKSGDIVSEEGKKLGQHQGLVRYTVGQRRGLGVSLGTDPLYVISLNAEKNQVVVGGENSLFSTYLEAQDPVWAPGFGTESFRAYVKIRLASAPAPALVRPLEDGQVRVDFDEAQRAIAPGQSAAFYVALDEKLRSAPSLASLGLASSKIIQGSIIAGGAIINRAGN